MPTENTNPNLTMTLSTGRTITLQNGTSEYFYEVVDGQYTSEVFNSLEEAQADAASCEADESYSGRVAIARYEIGDAGDGEVIESRGDDHRLSIGTATHSFAIRCLHDEANAAHNRHFAID